MEDVEHLRSCFVETWKWVFLKIYRLIWRGAKAWVLSTNDIRPHFYDVIELESHRHRRCAGYRFINVEFGRSRHADFDGEASVCRNCFESAGEQKKKLKKKKKKKRKRSLTLKSTWLGSRKKTFPFRIEESSQSRWGQLGLWSRLGSQQQRTGQPFSNVWTNNKRK